MSRSLRSRRAASPRQPSRRSAVGAVSRARIGLAAVMGLALAAALVVVGLGRGYPATHSQMGTGSIWLPSDATGELTLFDSSTLKPAAQVPVARPGTLLQSAETGSTGYAMDETLGAIRRVDGTTLIASPPAELVKAVGTNAGRDLDIFATPAALYAVDEHRGLLAAADPSSLTVRGTLQSLAASTTPSDTVIDQDGRFWVLDQRSGDLAWFTGSNRHVRTRVVPPGTSAVLAASADHPVIVAPGQQTAQLLAPDTGAVEQTIPVDLRPGDTVTAVGAADTPQVVLAVGSRGLVVVCSFSTTQCQPPIPLPDGAAVLGQPVEVGGRVFLPDETHRKVIVIDLTTGHARAWPIPPPATRFDLLTKDGIVFYDDPTTSAAGVIPIDGPPRSGSKYDPRKPFGASAPLRAPGGNTSTTPPSQRAQPAVGPTGPPIAQPTDVPATSTPSTGGPSTPGLPPTPTVTPPTSTTLVITAVVVVPGQPQVGQKATITAAFTGPKPTSWTWTVTPVGGGGHTYRSQQPSMQTTFGAPGRYTITATGTSGTATATKSTTVTISPSPNARCGETITASLVLNTDLSCTDGGLIIGADNVTLDLGSHTVTGPGATITGSVGVSTQHNNVTIRDGTITRFSQGISLKSGPGIEPAVSISSVNLTTDGTAIEATGAKAALSGVKIAGSAAGITAAEFNLTMSDSSVNGGTISCGSCGYLFTRDSFTNASISCALTSITISDSVLSQSPVNTHKCGGTISGSTLENASSAAVTLFFGPVDISNNKFLNDGIGIKVDPVGPSGGAGPITGNLFQNGGVAGVLIDGDSTVAVNISGNTFTGDGHSSGGTHDHDGNPVMDGLHIDLQVNPSNNVTVTGNHTSNDAAFGIWAKPGTAIDGGGNTSLGDPRGCSGVTCR